MGDSSIKNSEKPNMLSKTSYNIKKFNIIDNIKVKFTSYCHITRFEISPYQKSSQLKQFRKEQILA
jgi:hypothetical protein